MDENEGKEVVEDEQEEEEEDLEPEMSELLQPQVFDSGITVDSFATEIGGDWLKYREVGVVTEQHLKDIAHELGLIKLCWEDVPLLDFEGRLHYPPSYLVNNKKEKLLLWYAENFRQQFVHNYPHRRPLLIACDNECKLQKMVCTTIRPTTVKFPEFQSWQGCASFVAEHLTFEVLDSPTVLPDHINSPQTVLRRQAGHSFEYATLLASFLIGSGYDAYVVSGYATREICQKDQTRVECPILPDEPEVEEKEEILEDSKYFLKKPVELESQFLLAMEAREVQKQRDAQRAQELAELAAIKEFEKPPPDELWGWRLHSWVVVLPSKEVVEPFFIETTTGIAKSLEDPDYHGIESLWNHLNYWVFVQFESKTDTCKDISFDLNNPANWERLLVAEPITFRQMPPELSEADTDEFVRACIEAEKHLDMPTSWVDILQLSHSAYEARYPKAKKTVNYRKAFSEQFSPYSQSDGLMERVTRYEDYDCTIPIEIKERYGNRADRMYFCRKTVEDNAVHEKFERGREDALKEHFYYSMDSGIESKFTLLFYNEARLDGLSKLIMDPVFFTTRYQNSPDFIEEVHVDFEERINHDQPLRVINKITVKFHRNPKKDAEKDVALAEYMFAAKKLHLKFHYELEHLTQADRTFLKPTLADKGALLTFDPSLTFGYLTGPNVPQPKPLYLFRLETEFLKEEESVTKKIRERENELLCLLRLRAQELAAPRLVVSEFDVERNSDARKAFKDKEQQKKEMEEREMDMVCDFLAPYYTKYGFAPKAVLGRKDALKTIEECLQDWKTLLVTRANNLQQQFEQTCQDFQDKNNWYEQNQSTITKEQEEEYFEYCKRNSYYLHILEVRLNRHKEMAPRRYQAINSYLRSDPRLVQVYSKSHRRPK